MNLWLRTFLWTFFHELLAAVLSILVGIGAVVSGVSVVTHQPSLVLAIGLVGCIVALTVWWRYARQFVSEPDPVLDDPRPFTARLAADMTTTLFGVGVVTLCMMQILEMGEPQAKWGLLATILGGPFIALGLGAAWERWNKRTFGV
jgi:hypothetical protein